MIASTTYNEALKTYAELLNDVSIKLSITPNDSALLGAILGTYIYQNKLENNQHLIELLNRISPKVGN